MIEIFDTLLVFPIINLLLALYHAVSFLHIPYALGFAIILLTIVIRLILYPLTHSQLRMSKKMQDIAPHVSKLKDKHKGDAMKLQQETMRLYKEHGVNPVAGCLPTLLQLPLIWALYGVLQHLVSGKEKEILTYVNKIAYTDWLKLSQPWDTHFFGLPLGQGPSQLISTIGPFILLVPLLTGVFQLIQSRMMFGKKPDEAKTPSKKVTKDKPKQDDFATAFQTQSLFIFPLMIGFFSFQFPIGLSLYWNTFTIFGILQQYQVSGLGGLKGWLDKTPLKGKIHDK